MPLSKANTGLKKVCKTLSQTLLLEEIRQTVVTHQISTEARFTKISSLIEYGRARLVTHIVTHHTFGQATKGQKQSLPQTTPFSKQISNIYIFPDLTILFVLTVHFHRRFDRPEIRFNSRPQDDNDPLYRQS